jgi:hypothetical protein
MLADESFDTANKTFTLLTFRSAVVRPGRHWNPSDRNVPLNKLHVLSVVLAHHHSTHCASCSYIAAQAPKIDQPLLWLWPSGSGRPASLPSPTFSRANSQSKLVEGVFKAKDGRSSGSATLCLKILYFFSFQVKYGTMENVRLLHSVDKPSNLRHIVKAELKSEYGIKVPKQKKSRKLNQSRNSSQVNCDLCQRLQVQADPLKLMTLSQYDVICFIFEHLLITCTMHARYDGTDIANEMLWISICQGRVWGPHRPGGRISLSDLCYICKWYGPGYVHQKDWPPVVLVT